MTDSMMIAMIAINKWLYFGWNFEQVEIPILRYDGNYEQRWVPQFLAEAKWTCNKEHMLEKWTIACQSKDPDVYMTKFYAGLDDDNRKALLEWVLGNYNGERKLF